MRPEVNSNRFEISNRFEKSFRLHAQMILAPLLAIIKTNRESATTYDCMKAREICDI